MTAKTERFGSMTRRYVFGLIAALVLTSGLAQAQEVSVRFYLVPKIGDGLTPNTGFRPKYVADLIVDTSTGNFYSSKQAAATAGVSIAAMKPLVWEGQYYGLEPVYLVAADVTAAQHASIAANVDVIVIPQNLDNTISLTALSTVQQKLEDLHIPAGWVTTDHTYRDVLRVVRRAFQFFARMWVLQAEQGQTPTALFTGAVTLDTRMNQLTAAQRQALTETCASFNIDTSWVLNTTTLRQLLKGIADRLPGLPMKGEAL
jgi:hypothetical protein